MPTYDYACTVCGHIVELMHGREEAGPSVCTVCGGSMRKLMSAPSVVFKGTGWAKRDRASSRTGGDAGAAPGSAAGASPDAAGGDKAGVAATAGEASSGGGDGTSAGAAPKSTDGAGSEKPSMTSETPVASKASKAATGGHQPSTSRKGSPSGGPD